MPIYEQAQAQAYIDSSVTTSFTASPGTDYTIDTATAAVTATLPAAGTIGQVITLRNAPANGPQMGGTVTGNTLTILTTSPETFDDGTSSDTLGPPTSMITAACRTYYPTGPGTQAGFNGWVH
jgi:hypothetical protein